MDVALSEYRAVAVTLAGIAALLVLILRAKMNAFIALLLIAILCAVAAGMAPELAYQSVTNGFGGTLGFIAPIIGLGAIFGAILQASGGIDALARGVGQIGSTGRQTWTMGGLGLLAATPVFFDVALIILLPFILALATRARRPAMLFGLPLCAGLAAGHAFIPPTPGPIAIAELIGAELGWVILFGAITGLISVAVAGPLFARFLDRRGALPDGDIAFDIDTDAGTRRDVAFPIAIALIAFPLALILIGTLAKALLGAGPIRDTLAAIGHPFAALILACGATWLALKPKTEDQKTALKTALAKSLEPTGAVILVTGAGGAFKQVLVDTGAGADLAAGVLALGLTPVFAGFVLAQLVRLAQGSATVAMITAAGLAAPIVDAADPSQPQLGIIVIAIAAGATGFSHVNDSGFWLVSRLFGLSESQTLRTWTLSTGLIGLTGLAISCLLYLLV
ncbi:gluconate:H+ symporter [Henriciella sp. AS95]|uniref:GntP family permease n=1 Tax=Henriciella sp. AS95 TaxID=3135782 RepID=UPI00317C3DDC